MKVKVEKKPDGGLELDFNGAPFHGIVVVTLRRDQIDLVAQMLKTAKEADRFAVTLEI